jgi:hypothetical protein
MAQNGRNAVPVFPFATTTAGSAGPIRGDGQMRIFSLVLACSFLLAGSTMAGLADGDLPGVGTFSYHVSPITTSASLSVAIR